MRARNDKAQQFSNETIINGRPIFRLLQHQQRTRRFEHGFLCMPDKVMTVPTISQMLSKVQCLGGIYCATDKKRKKVCKCFVLSFSSLQSQAKYLDTMAILSEHCKLVVSRQLCSKAETRFSTSHVALQRTMHFSVIYYL